MTVKRPLTSVVTSYQKIAQVAVTLWMLAAGNALALTAQEWLLRMESSATDLTYQGVLVYSQGARMETLQVYHTVINDVQRERLVHLTGEPREIVREGDKVICVHPKNGVMRLDTDVPAGPFARNYAARLRELDEPYSVQLGGSSRVAGRAVTLLEVQPKDAYRYGFRLALDQSTGLLLQSLMVDHAGKVLERFEYTAIEIGGDIDEAQLRPTVDQSRDQLSIVDVHTGLPVFAGENDANGSDQQQSQWRVTWMPAGFAMSAAAKLAGQPSKLRASEEDSMMYSDGLTAFSVFVARDVDMSELSAQSGATVAVSTLKRDQQGSYSVTVVGEIPPVAAHRIANSVERNP